MKESQLEYIGLTKFDRDCINILIRNELKLLESGNTDCGEFEIMILKGLLKKINTAKKAGPSPLSTFLKER